MKHYLFFIAQNYSFEILRPLQQQIINNGDQVLWFVYGNNVNLSLFTDNETYTQDAAQAVAFNPIASFVPGNIIPNFIPGLKVQVFHGFEWKKKGHFVIRDCFDLYCTQGPLFTDKFNQLAKKHPHFDVVETGWPKLDPLFKTKAMQVNCPELPCILYAPTFSPALTSAPDLFDQIVHLSHQQDWQWLIKFHPKMDKTWVDKFKHAAHAKLQIVEDAAISPVLHAADVILSDTSSIITEFMLLSKPAVTYKNAQPEPELIDFTNPKQLLEKLEYALNLEPSELAKIDAYTAKMHPYQDGLSSKRILAAVDNIVLNGKKAPKNKPWNLIRNLKMRKKLAYWK
ncbi:CDP-glycerol glycerophosphotransferase family protein [Catenovulum sp. 2E275]|uniref:CDP-glycerol glycerophosphotransferase family protein n=1 Tax=Catenovulum sp. 2E275 TaxID=2980497 RepID=UPI0021D052EA|nr:CDP-glycerol glycerophosphotransferase family protein [Catenovulum sp. 2E275]MCU4674230.1 CDP-glycerol glycerophosphotransferase family protein [Catenovulum sp. 2E275]